MDWEAFGAIAETVGALAVVVTLLFLAKQMRLLSNQSANTTSWSVSQALSESNNLIASDAELADIWQRGREGLAVLSENEALRFRMYAWSRINIAIYIFEHEPAGAFKLAISQMAQTISRSAGLREICMEAKSAMPDGLFEKLVVETD